jgi:hypothetical protein
MGGVVGSRWLVAPQRILFALCGVLTMAIFYEIAAPLPDVAVPELTPRAFAGAVPASQRFSPPPVESFAAINARPIFSPERKPIEPVAIASANGPSQLLKAILVGVIMDAQNRLALIKTAASPLAEAFAVGATIEGWQVQEIDTDKVVLRSGAAQDEIRLDADRASGVDVRSAPPSSATTGIVAQAPEQVSTKSQLPIKSAAQSVPAHPYSRRAFAKPVVQDSGPNAFPAPPNLQGARD